MKKCIECGKISTDEDVKEYAYMPVITKDGKNALIKTNIVNQESCPLCGAIVVSSS
jgi:endogenous inhibitor of DNA gyrase (YacG/DUF329 family)